MENSVWNLLKPDDNEPVKPMLDYIAQQADELKTITKNNVKAVFCQARHPESFKMPLFRVGQSTQDRNTLKHDAATFFDETYEFYITDMPGEYELAVFILKCRDFFPAKLYIDETIAQEANCSRDIILTNFEQFKGIFTKLLNTEKVRYVIYKLDNIMKTAANA